MSTASCFKSHLLFKTLSFDSHVKSLFEILIRLVDLVKKILDSFLKEGNMYCENVETDRRLSDGNALYEDEGRFSERSSLRETDLVGALRSLNKLALMRPDSVSSNMILLLRGGPELWNVTFMMDLLKVGGNLLKNLSSF